MRALVYILVLLVALPAAARNGQVYFELAPAWGFFVTDEVIIENGDDGGAATPPVGFVPQLKLGVNLFGWAGAELDVAGVFWDPDDNERGGGGYVGGVFRLTPLEALTYVLPPDLELPSLVPAGPVDWHNRPFDLGIYIGGGYHIIGEDFAYEGGYLKWGFDMKFYVTPMLAIGLDFPFRHSLFKPFRYTDYQDSQGYCTEGAKAIGRGGVEVRPSPQRFGGLEFTDDEDCAGPAPSAFLFSPGITISGGFDFGL